MQVSKAGHIITRNRTCSEINVTAWTAATLALSLDVLTCDFRAERPTCIKEAVAAVTSAPIATWNVSICMRSEAACKSAGNAKETKSFTPLEIRTPRRAPATQAGAAATAQTPPRHRRSTHGYELLICQRRTAVGLQSKPYPARESGPLPGSSTREFEDPRPQSPVCR